MVLKEGITEYQKKALWCQKRTRFARLNVFGHSAKKTELAVQPYHFHNALLPITHGSTVTLTVRGLPTPQGYFDNLPAISYFSWPGSSKWMS